MSSCASVSFLFVSFLLVSLSSSFFLFFLAANRYYKVLDIERTHPKKAPIGEGFLNKIHSEKGDGWSLQSPDAEMKRAAGAGSDSALGGDSGGDAE